MVRFVVSKQPMGLQTLYVDIGSSADLFVIYRLNPHRLALNHRIPATDFPRPVATTGSARLLDSRLRGNDG